jgi:hypothetical protein
MSRTHHAANAYRLSCGCITEFASVQVVGSLAERHTILCRQCGSDTSKILVRYPDNCCGATCRADSPKGGVVRVWCSLDKRHRDEHYDETVDVHFKVPARLRSGKIGAT